MHTSSQTEHNYSPHRSAAKIQMTEKTYFEQNNLKNA